MRKITACIPKSHIGNLLDYSYSGVDKSIMSNLFLNRFWNAAVTFVPMHMAPNMVTTIGFLITVASVLLTAYYYCLGVVLPDYVWFVNAAALFSYSTLDAIDGKHARRTFAQGPLGELFDHGCDAFVTPLINFVGCVMVGSSPSQTIILFLCLSGTQVLTIWEQYCTGTMELWYINGPVEGLYILIASFALTGVYSTAFWAQPFAFGPLVLHKGLGIEVSNPTHILIAIVIGGGFAQIFSAVVHTLQGPRVRDPLNCILPLVMFAILFNVIFFARAPLLALQQELPFVLELAFGILCAFFATSMTISRLCKIHFANMTHVLYCVNLAFVMCVGVVMNAALTPIKMPRAELLATYHIHALCIALPLFNVGFYIVFLFGAFRQIADYFKINLLTLTEAQLKKIHDAGLVAGKGGAKPTSPAAAAAAPTAAAGGSSRKRSATPRGGRSRSRTPSKKKK